MARRKLFPTGKSKKIQILINKDFEKETKADLKKASEKYHLLPNETETELIKRIQQDNLKNCERECLKCKNKQL